MCRSYDHLHAEIYTSKINTIDNGSVVSRIIVKLVDNGDRFLLMVNVVAVGGSFNFRCIYFRLKMVVRTKHVTAKD
jgi:hypothetical protein